MCEGPVQCRDSGFEVKTTPLATILVTAVDRLFSKSQLNVAPTVVTPKMPRQRSHCTPTQRLRFPCSSRCGCPSKSFIRSRTRKTHIARTLQRPHRPNFQAAHQTIVGIALTVPQRDNLTPRLDGCQFVPCRRCPQLCSSSKFTHVAHITDVTSPSFHTIESTTVGTAVMVLPRSNITPQLDG